MSFTGIHSEDSQAQCLAVGVKATLQEQGGTWASPQPSLGTCLEPVNPRPEIGGECS